MSKIDVIRAWKDEDYRSSLSDAQRSELPDNPAGWVELSGTDLDAAAGGDILPITALCPSFPACTLYTICLCPTLDHCPTVGGEF